MKTVSHHLLAAAICAVPIVAFAAVGEDDARARILVSEPKRAFADGTMIAAVPPNLVAPNAVPGGITLVPGTVIIPGVGGTAVTGTVPLAGTVGSPGVGNLDPGLGMIPNVPGANDALYPPATYPQVGLPSINQSALPQTVPSAPDAPGIGSYGSPIPFIDGVLPSVANCPAGVTSSNGTC
jgi:hypothetical protein